MSVTFADLIVIGIIVLSAVFGLMRGFTREVLSLGSWIGAAIATIYGQPHLRPFVMDQLGNELAADIVSAVVIFIVALVVLSVLTHAISSRVRESRAIGALDRSLGVVFGLARGALIIIALWLVIDYLAPENPPRTIREARTLPYVKQATEFVMSVVPSNLRSRARSTADDARSKAEQAERAAKAVQALRNGDAAPQDEVPEKGYTKEQNREKNRLFDSVTEGQ